jgi:hypothetical protein
MQLATTKGQVAGTESTESATPTEPDYTLQGDSGRYLIEKYVTHRFARYGKLLSTFSVQPRKIS